MISSRRFTQLLLIVSLVLFTITCTKKSDIKQYGQISGKVKNAVTGEPVSGANVSLSPGNSSTITGSDGAYSFDELEPVTYNIQVVKDGFKTNTTSVNVVAGENRLGDILITPAQPVLRVSTTLLDYGSDKLLLPFEIHNDGAGQLTWNVAVDQLWMSANPTSGSTTAGVSSVNISIDRTKLGRTTYTGTVVVSSNGGSATINVTVNVNGPLLNVSATLLEYGTDKTLLPFDIHNNGAGQLTWTIATDKPWISAAPTSGSTTTGNSTVSVSIDRSQIGKSTYTGTVVVSSNGGSATINVTANVNGPVLNVTPVNMDFGSTETEKTLQVSNIGVGTLNYSAVASNGWITFQNSSGTTTTEIKLIQVMVNRAGMAPGSYSGSVVINSNANNVTIPVLLQVLAPTAPVVVNGTVSGVNDNSAQVSGNITSLGSSAVTQHGHCWSISPTPTIANSKTLLGYATNTGGFVSNLTDLSPATIYYVRAYATSSVGTSYSNELQFTTEVGSKPTVNTASITGIMTTTASGGGNVTAQGGTPVTARGVCWSTNANPTMTDNHTIDGNGTGSYTSSLTGLTPATSYYVRAYATNSAGTTYGNQVQFATDAGSPPTVTTAVIGSITATTAIGGGNVTAQGGTPVTVRGICWSTGTNPSISGSHTADGIGTGSYSSNLTGLSPQTTYYVRAYATNAAGLTYGNQVQFVTETGQVPTVATSNITNIAATTATGGGNVTAEGSTPVTERGICWSTNPNPTTSSSFSANGTGAGSFISNLSGLSATTTYYVRAYAKNSIGTSYGSEVSFITTVAPPVVTNGLLAYYMFDDQTAHDWTGNYNGTIQGGVTSSSSTPNNQNYSMQFDGSTGFINIPYNFLYNLNTTSFCFWVKTTQGGGFWVTEDVLEYYSNFGIGLIQNKITTSNAGNHHTSQIDYSFLADNNWHQLTVTDGNGQEKIYVDGVYYETITVSSIHFLNKPNRIGLYSSGGSKYFNGNLDNIRVYNRVLSQAEITEIVNAKQ